MLNHPAATLLIRYAVEGCLVNYCANWTLEIMDAVIQQGVHLSACKAKAAKAFREEALASVKEKNCRLVN